MSEKQLVWEAELDDGKYDCAVHRVDERHGQLTVTQRDTKTVIVDEQVNLSYGAAFGPDVSDIAHWQELICQKIPEE